uniref:CCHC-type domain-containing protein n=1 Tax=Peronospora matthiolae TaxID=2874970 RepID=A0AAV1V172_9STRA
MFNHRTELADLQYIVDELDMREPLLASLPTTTHFNQLRQTVRFASDSAAYSPEKIRVIRTAAALHEETTSGFGIGALMCGRRKDVERQRDKKARQIMGRKGSNANVYRYKGTFKAKDYKKRCYTCGSSEHLKRDCPDREKHGEGANIVAAKGVARREGKRNMATNLTHCDVLKVFGEDQDEGTLELNHVEEAQQDNDPLADNIWIQEWYIDTASNAHVIGDKRYFIRYREHSRHEATVRGVAPRFQEQPVGVGAISLESSVAGKKVLTVIDDVLLVPGARNMLLSMGRALDDGFKFEWDSNAHRLPYRKVVKRWH